MSSCKLQLQGWAKEMELSWEKVSAWLQPATAGHIRLVLSKTVPFFCTRLYMRFRQFFGGVTFQINFHSFWFAVQAGPAAEEPSLPRAWPLSTPSQKVLHWWQRFCQRQEQDLLSSSDPPVCGHSHILCVLFSEKNWLQSQLWQCEEHPGLLV